MRIILAFIFLLGKVHLSAQIQAGPMLFHVDMREVRIWVQTRKAAEIECRYGPLVVAGPYFSARAITEESNGYIATLQLDAVEPGTRYYYEIWLDGQKVSFDYPLEFQTQELWKWRTDPPDFRFAFASCFYVNDPPYDRPGKPYGQNFQILEHLYKTRPDFMVWGGDNTYLREPDWGGRNSLLKRYTHTRSFPGLQPLLASTAHYATWDDHDFGPDNSDRSFYQKKDALEVFKMFWKNPNYIFDEGVTGSFTWGDCQFFLLDNRWWRSPNDLRSPETEKSYYGKDQLQWLLEALSYSKATFKFIVTGGQFISPVATKENMANYPQERAYLLQKLEEEGIPGIIFLTGDRHYSCLMRMERPDSYPLFDLTVSPLTAGAGGPEKAEKDAPFVEGTVVEKTQAFGILEVSGKERDRKLTIQVIDADGKTLWTKTIKAGELGW